MIPRDYITQWRERAPWSEDFQIEQDLIISRALVEIFSNAVLAGVVAFRRGTVLYKLYLTQPGSANIRRTCLNYRTTSCQSASSSYLPLSSRKGREVASRRLARVSPQSKVLRLASPPRYPSRIAWLMVVAMPPKLGHARSPGKAQPARFARSGDRSRLS